MAKYNLSGFKEKIASRDKKEIEEAASNKFKRADEALGVSQEEAKTHAEPQSFTRIVRKTFSIPEAELGLIAEVKDRALNKKLVLAESEIMRLGLLIASKLSEDELVKASKKLEKMPLGRPKIITKTNQKK